MGNVSNLLHYCIHPPPTLQPFPVNQPSSSLPLPPTVVHYCPMHHHSNIMSNWGPRARGQEKKKKDTPLHTLTNTHTNVWPDTDTLTQRGLMQECGNFSNCSTFFHSHLFVSYSWTTICSVSTTSAWNQFNMYVQKSAWLTKGQNVIISDFNIKWRFRVHKHKHHWGQSGILIKN